LKPSNLVKIDDRLEKYWKIKKNNEFYSKNSVIRPDLNEKQSLS
jgi:hypothetical protein